MDFICRAAPDNALPAMIAGLAPGLRPSARSLVDVAAAALSAFQPRYVTGSLYLGLGVRPSSPDGRGSRKVVRQAVAEFRSYRFGTPLKNCTI